MAQAEWASPAFGTEIVAPGRFKDVQESSEARAFHLIREEQFEQVPSACEEWATNEPYSIRPYEFGSSTAGMIDDFQTCERLARDGLVIRPDAPILINNLAFALASTGRASEAEKELLQLKVGGSDVPSLVALANRGLAAFRSGKIDAGRKLYEDAIRGFEQLHETRFAAIAQVYLAREAARARCPDHEKLLKAAKARVEKLSSPLISKVLGQVDQLVAQVGTPEVVRSDLQRPI